MRSSRLFAVFAALSISSALASADEPTTVRMAHPPLALHELPLLVASEKGFYAAEGLNVTHTFTTGGNEAATALIGGNIDVLNSALTQPMKLRSMGAAIKIISGVAGVRDWGIVVDKKRFPDAKDLSSLKGLRIATPRRGSDGDQILRFVLNNAGFDLDHDVQLIQIGGFENALIAMDKGDLDGAILAEPFFSSGIRQGTTSPVFDILRGDGPDILRERIFSGLVVTDDFLKNHRDITEKIVRATKQAAQLIYDDPAAGLAVAQKYFPTVDPAVLKATYDRLASATKGRAYDTRLPNAAIDAENKFLIEAGTIQSPVKYDDIVDTAMSKVW
jgi:NitT/TauT family transport system substrate-binding protein